MVWRSVPHGLCGKSLVLGWSVGRCCGPLGGGALSDVLRLLGVFPQRRSLPLCLRGMQFCSTTHSHHHVLPCQKPKAMRPLDYCLEFADP
jgi:hypothetical protein